MKTGSKKPKESKQDLRYKATFAWAMQAELQQLNQIIKGVEDKIVYTTEDGTFETGVSNNDMAAIEWAIKCRVK